MTKQFASLLLLLSSFSVAAQNAGSDTTFLARSVANAKKNYLNAVRGESPLYIGSDYAEYVPIGEEDPYYLSNDWIMGDLLYDNFLYEDVPLQYDISSQKLITEHLTSAKKIQVVHEKVLYFTLQGHRFVRLDKKVTDTFNESPGFYDLLVDGATKLYARRTKNLQRNVVSGKLEAKFEDINKYYIEKDNVFYPVKSKGSALKVLADRKSELSKALKRNRVRFGANRENGLVQTVKLYNHPGQ